MTQTISQIADIAVRLKAKADKSTSWPVIARKAIEAKGIRFKADIERLAPQVLAELRKRANSTRGRHAHAHS